MLPAEIYSQVKRLEIETNRIIDSSFAGEYQSAFKGRGIEFDQVRAYSDGDDIRFIDWNVTAKMNFPYVKIFREERELSIFLLVDRSSSMLFGSADESKKDLLLKIAALLALVSMKNNDRVGLIIYSDKIEKIVTPKKGRKHVLRLIRELLAFEPVPGKTDLAKPLELLNKIAKRKSVVFILSDFKSDGFEKALELSARKHDIVPILIKDRLEQQFKPDGFLRLKDLETRQTIIINTKDPEFINKFQINTTKQYKDLKKYFLKLNLDLLDLTAGQPYITPLISFFKRRTNRRAC